MEPLHSGSIADYSDPKLSETTDRAGRPGATGRATSIYSSLTSSMSNSATL
jgi:hypothetical protein